MEGSARIDATQGARRPPLLVGGRPELGGRDRYRCRRGTAPGGAHGCCGVGGRRSRATARTRTRRVPCGVAGLPPQPFLGVALFFEDFLALLAGVRLAVAALRVVVAAFFFPAFMVAGARFLVAVVLRLAPVALAPVALRLAAVARFLAALRSLCAPLAFFFAVCSALPALRLATVACSWPFS